MEMTRTDKAIEYFMNGANCAQAVVAAFADLIGMDERIALRISAPFGGGLARQREVCGAVTGMCMVAGYLYGYDELSDDVQKAEHYRLIRTLCDAFRAAHDGHIVCRDLLGVKRGGEDTAPAPSPRTEEYYRIRPCARQVGTAASILEDYISKHPIV